MVQKWRKRETRADAPIGRKYAHSTVSTPTKEAVAVARLPDANVTPKRVRLTEFCAESLTVQRMVRHAVARRRRWLQRGA